MNKIVEIDSNWAFIHCPSPSNLQINWIAILAQFPALQTLSECQENPPNRAEGNVWMQTQLVCEILVSLPDWQVLTAPDRSILFVAALFHDFAKLEPTRLADNGRSVAKGYINIRQILQTLQIPFPIRETIVAIVRYGNLPLWFWDKSQPLRSVINVSQVVRCDLLAVMAEADTRARVYEDSGRLLDAIDFFREFCREHNCLDRPYQFISAHSRFMYFQKEDADPTYEAYDDTQLEVILMCGLPGTGKDYWIEQNHPNLPMVSLDRLRQTMGVSPSDRQGEIVQAGKELAKAYLQSDLPFVWNATNIVKPIRSGLIQLFANYHARIRIVYLELPIERVLKQNRDRKASVPNAVIHRFRDRLEIPNITEAHQVDYIVEV
jgi:predicted kinase